MNDYNQLSRYDLDVDNESEDNQDNGMYLTDVILTQYLPLLMLPFIGYLIITYVRPVISFHLKQKADNYFHVELDVVDFDDDEQQAKVEVAKKWKMSHLHCMFGANNIIYVVFFVRPVELFHILVDLSKGVRHQYILYVNAILPVLVFTLCNAMVTAPTAYKYVCRRISVISSLSILISVNIIYTVCYSIPRMVVAFVHDPVLATYMCFTAIGIVMSLYPLSWFCSALGMLSVLAMKQVYAASLPFKQLFCFLISVIFALSCFCIMFVIVIAGAVMVTMNYSDHQYLRVSYLLMGFLAICFFKPIHHRAYKHATENAKLALNAFDPDNPWMNDGDEERNGTDSYAIN